MKTVGDLLRNADPLSHEGMWSSQHRAIVQQRVQVAAQSGPRTAARRMFLLLAATACAVVTVVVVSPQFAPSAVQAAIHFEVRLAEDRPEPGLQPARVAGSNRLVYLHQEVVVTNDDIAQTSVISGGAAGQFGVSLEFTASGSDKMRQATANHIGRPVAILLDGQVISAPTLRSVISKSAVIDGRYSRDEAERIVNGITAR